MTGAAVSAQDVLAQLGSQSTCILCCLELNEMHKSRHYYLLLLKF